MLHIPIDKMCNLYLQQIHIMFMMKIIKKQSLKILLTVYGQLILKKLQLLLPSSQQHSKNNNF